MLDLVYIALVAAPLGIAAVAMLLVALRGFRGHVEEREAERRRAIARASAQPGGLRRREAPLEEPPSIATVPDIATLSRRRPSLVDLSGLVESLAGSFEASPAAGASGAVLMKRCPDCAEEVLAAARVCKHCRYRWDEPGSSALSA